MRASDRAGRGGHDPDDPNLALSGAGSAAGCGQLQLRGRELAGRRVGGDDDSRGSHQRRRGHAVHVVDLGERRLLDYHHHLPDRLQSRHRCGRRAKPRGHRAGPAARRGEQHRHLHHQGELQLCAGGGVHLARPLALAGLHLQLPRRLCCGRAEACSRGGRVIIFGERKYAMRIWLDPAKLAARESDAAGRDQRAGGAERRSARRTAWPPALRSQSGVPDGSASGRPADGSEPVREHYSQVERFECAGRDPLPRRRQPAGPASCC